MRASLGLALALVALVACRDGGGDDPGGEGAACTGDEQCADGLVCEYGACRPACTFDRDCAEGSACVTAPDGSGRVCTLLDEGDCMSGVCPAGLVCSADGICREPCDGVTCGAGLFCVDGVCVEDPAGSGGDADSDGDSAG